eukprot:CAMPEP_0116896628 /NCGR_PEP_ID=MMETSP0467-20121206/5814_1 /TAXON_ID=283647 /ORGANISM="Mesodinium pulex, Strain SPMC105" /LENGTH=56 /DNA_ID=CAMNT_0004567873 /DNA_START=741 /DNA_END=911 /DNA_ORIENTATION=+
MQEFRKAELADQDLPVGQQRFSKMDRDFLNTKKDSTTCPYGDYNKETRFIRKNDME